MTLKILCKVNCVFGKFPYFLKFWKVCLIFIERYLYQIPLIISEYWKGLLFWKRLSHSVLNSCFSLRKIYSLHHYCKKTCFFSYIFFILASYTEKHPDFWCTKILTPQGKFRRMLCCCVPLRAPNEIYYGKMKQCNNILLFPRVSAERLSEKRKPRLHCKLYITWVWS